MKIKAMSTLLTGMLNNYIKIKHHTRKPYFPLGKWECVEVDFETVKPPVLCSAETALPISFHMKANMGEVWPVMGNGHNGGVWLGLGKG